MILDEELQLRLESEVGRYLQVTMAFLERLLDWRGKHEAHDHDDPEVKRLCLRDWSYLEHEGKILMETGRLIEEDS